MAENAFTRFGNRLLSPGNISDENVRRNREMSQQLLRQVSSPQNIQHPTQGLALLMNALNAQIFRQKANRGESALKEQKATQMGELLGSLNLSPEQQGIVGNLPPDSRQKLLTEVSAQRLLKTSPTATTKQFREGNEFVTRRIVDGRPDMTEAGVIGRSNIDRTQRIETTEVPFELPGNRDNEIKRQRNVVALTGELAESLRNVQQNPSSTGMIGAASEAANTFGDVPIIGDFITTVTEAATGLDPTNLAVIRTQGKAMVAKLVPVITGDDSGRYTDREQERTEQIQAQSKFWKTSAQVIGGLSELQSIQIRGELRTTGQQGLDLLAGFHVDLSTDNGIDLWGQILVERFGLPDAKALAELTKHIEILSR